MTLVGLTISSLPTAASAEVVVRLESGSEISAVRAWREGDVVNVQFRSGVAAFPVASIVAIEEVAPTDRLPPAPAEAAVAPGEATAAAEVEDQPHPPAVKPPALTVDEQVPNVPNEDAQTKMERLDGLSMQTRRQLSVARTQGQSQQTLEALQRKIDEINRQRTATMKRLGTVR